MGAMCRDFGRFLCPNVLFMQISPVVDVAVCLSSTSKDVLLILTLCANLFVVAALDVILFLKPHGCAKSMLDVLFRVFSGSYSASCCGSRSKLECLKSTTVVCRRAADCSRNFANPVESNKFDQYQIICITQVGHASVDASILTSLQRITL
jgi:hypothetical protein